MIVIVTTSPSDISPPVADPVSIIVESDSIALIISSFVTGSGVTVPASALKSTVCVEVALETTVLPAASLEAIFTSNDVSFAKSAPATSTLYVPSDWTVVEYSVPFIVIVTISPSDISPPVVDPVNVIVSPDSTALITSSVATTSGVIVPSLATVSFWIVSDEVVLFPAESVDATVVVNVPSFKDDKSIFSTEYEPSSFNVISSVSTVTVFVPSVIVIESTVEPTSTFPVISEDVDSLAFITLSVSDVFPSVILISLGLIVSTVISCVVDSVFPAESVAVMVKFCVPSDNSSVMIE